MLENYTNKEFNIYIPKDSEQSHFQYSDGEESEAYLREVLSTTSDLSSNSIELGRKSKDWPSFYHLTPRRSNLLRPLKDTIQGKSVLEIGAGCGGITRYLGEVAARVVAIEGSANRAYINSLRSKELPNVSIVCDNFQNYESGQKYDIATLIGVLEYSRMYITSHGKDELPEDVILKKVFHQLNDDGSLILAIENKLGLKYLAGYPEDHMGLPMFGIEGLYGDKTPVTFGKQELSELLLKAGFSHIRFYYPFPDYKVPTSVLCEELVQYQDQVDLSFILQTSERYDPQIPAYTTFSLHAAWGEVFKNRVWQDLSNSFLVIASKAPTVEKNLAYHYSIEREKVHQKELIFRKEGQVIKNRIERDPEKIEAISTSFQIEIQDEKIFHGQNWETELIRRINRPNWTLEDISSWIRTWVECLAKDAGMTVESLDLELSLPGRYLDAIPRNLIVSESGFQFIDLEWNYTFPITLRYLLLRGILHTVFAQQFVGRTPVLESTGMNKWNLAKKALLQAGFWVTENDFLHFLDQEVEFQQQVICQFKPIPLDRNFLLVEFQYKPYFMDIFALNRRVHDLEQSIHEKNRQLQLNEQSNQVQNLAIQDKERIIQDLQKSTSFRLGRMILAPLAWLLRRG